MLRGSFNEVAVGGVDRVGGLERGTEDSTLSGKRLRTQLNLTGRHRNWDPRLERTDPVGNDISLPARSAKQKGALLCFATCDRSVCVGGFVSGKNNQLYPLPKAEGAPEHRQPAGKSAVMTGTPSQDAWQRVSTNLTSGCFKGMNKKMTSRNLKSSLEKQN